MIDPAIVRTRFPALERGTLWKAWPFHAPEPIVGANALALLLGVNESWNRTTGASLAEAFHRAAA